MASVAGLREAGGDVIRNIASQGLRAGPVGSVAGVAGRAIQAVIVAHMALVAIGRHAGRRHLVIAGQGPARRGVAPGSRGKRRCRRVAVRAICERKGRARCRVHRVIGGVVVALMTVLVAATSRRWEVISAGGRAMALRALHGCGV